MANKLKRYLIFISTIGMLFFIVHSIDFTLLKPSFSNKFYICISISIALFYLALIVAAFRWYFLVKTTDPALKFQDIFYIFYLSNTLSTYIPGMLLGDYYRYKLFKRKTKTEGLYSKVSYSVLVDRILSLLSLSINVYIFLGFFVRSNKHEIAFLNYLFEFLATILCLIIIVYFSRVKIIKYLYFLEGFGGLKIYTFLKFINENKIRISLLIFISILANYIVLASFYFVTISYNLDLNLIASSTSVLLAFFGTLIPISPSGLGVSEYIYNEMYSIISFEAVNIIYIFVAFRIVCLIVNIPSLYFIIRDHCLQD